LIHRALGAVAVTTIAERDTMDDHMTDPRHPDTERSQPADIPRHLPAARKPVTKTALGGLVASVAGLGATVWLHVASVILGVIVGVVVLCALGFSAAVFLALYQLLVGVLFGDRPEPADRLEKIIKAVRDHPD
jgi:hypothetical protein